MNRLEPFGDYLRFVIVGSATTQQGTHAHHAEIVLRKANSGQSGMHVGQNHFLVVESDHGNIVRYAFPDSRNASYRPSAVRSLWQNTPVAPVANTWRPAP